MKDGNIGGDSMKKMSLLSGKKSVLNGMLFQIGLRKTGGFVYISDLRREFFRCERPLVSL